jgi:hypothetical protein
MDHPEGAGSKRADRVEFDRRVRVEFRGAQLSSDGGLLVMRELDDALGLSDLAVNGGVKLGHGAAQNWATLGLRGTRVMGGGQSAALSM